MTSASSAAGYLARRAGARRSGPRLLVYTAALEMHPLDTEDRLAESRQVHGVGYCNITRCCTKVCPESIAVRDNAIIPLKERVVDHFYDPLTRLFRVFRGSNRQQLRPPLILRPTFGQPAPPWGARSGFEKSRRPGRGLRTLTDSKADGGFVPRFDMFFPRASLPSEGACSNPAAAIRDGSCPQSVKT